MCHMCVVVIWTVVLLFWEEGVGPPKKFGNCCSTQLNVRWKQKCTPPGGHLLLQTVLQVSTFRMYNRLIMLIFFIIVCRIRFNWGNILVIWVLHSSVSVAYDVQSPVCGYFLIPWTMYLFSDTQTHTDKSQPWTDWTLGVCLNNWLYYALLFLFFLHFCSVIYHNVSKRWRTDVKWQKRKWQLFPAKKH